MFRALMDATEFDDRGLAIPDYGAAERQLMQELGLVQAIDLGWVAACRDTLWQNQSLQYHLQQYKPWDPAQLYHLNIGYDAETDRFVIPVYDRHRHIVNCRMYRPGGQPKILWLLPHLTSNFLWPVSAYEEPVLVLVEGEADAISLRSIGVTGISGMMGASMPVPEGLWHRGKIIYVLFDIDTKGQEAVGEAIRILRPSATEVRIVTLPQWPNRPRNADISDYLLYLRNEGVTLEQQQRMFSELLQTAAQVETPHDVFDQPADTQSFSTALSSDNLRRRLAFAARLTARSEKRFILPTTIVLTCPAGGHPYCPRCPMRTEFHGNARFNHDPRAGDTLKLIRSTQKEQLDVYKARHGIPTMCPDVTAETERAVNIEPVILNASAAEIGDGTQDNERQRREALIMLNGPSHLEENRDYVLEGFVYPEPKTQAAIFLIDRFTPSATTFDNFEITPPVQEMLEIFQPQSDETCMAKLRAVARDLAASVTMIRDREDLHLAYRTVWHSVLSYRFGGSDVLRGWIEAVVLGDTRCGKSATFRRMAGFYSLGLLVDCKLQTVAGILGSVVSSPNTGERYVLAGLYPQQDGGIVCLDEFQGGRSHRASLIDALSSTRSEGVVRITKAASASFRARVRSIWLCNPGMGKLLSELGITGIEALSRLIPQPEDIARFDFALAVSQGDVSNEVINQIVYPSPPTYSADASRALLAWTYSRKPEQIIFSPEAEAAVIELTRQMYTKYDSTIPFVEPADQRMRVSKVAVSVAAQLFSCDPSGQLLLVKPEHVETAGQLFASWYNKPTLAYDLYSEKIRAERTLRDEAEVRVVFDETVKPHGVLLASELLRLDEFTERTFGTLVPGAGTLNRAVIQLLYANRCLRLREHGRRESYELTPAFVAFLKKYISGVASS